MTPKPFDYATEYDRYWSRVDRHGSHRVDDGDSVVEQILAACGTGRVLDVGAGMGLLVRKLLGRGADAFGVDVSEVAVRECARMVPGRFIVGSALALPFRAEAFDTVLSTDCLEHLRESDVGTVLRELWRVARRNVFVRLATTPDRDGAWHLTVKDRSWWEQRFFEAGFRKHPAYYAFIPYEALESESWQITIILEKISSAALAVYPLASLGADRDLHMDMLRETGSRSDAHVARYQLATQYITAGDTVVDAACGLGYGAHVMYARSMAGQVTGIDSSSHAVSYATATFGRPGASLSFIEGELPACLAAFGDYTCDLVVSFETLEHVTAPAEVWKEFARILKPSGRVIVSVPNDWSDESGGDPNPHHLHVYDLGRLRSEIPAGMLLERLYEQTGSRRKSGTGASWEIAGRRLRELPTEQWTFVPLPRCEWWIAVAMKDPLSGRDVPYVETVFPQPRDLPEWHAVAFGRDYVNPWLVRGLVTIGQRLADGAQLADAAERGIDESRPGSADQGALLCVAAYRLLTDAKLGARAVAALDERINAYLNLSGNPNPHQIRWQISLTFAAGLLWQSVGAFDRALLSYERCAAVDPLTFSPLIATKTVEAFLRIGMLRIALGETAAAAAAWARAIEVAERALHADWKTAVGDLSQPVEFGLPELAAVVEKASACAYALTHLDLAESRPGVWWWQHNRDRMTQCARTARTATVARDQRETMQVQAHEIARLASELSAIRQSRWHLLGEALRGTKTGTSKYRRVARLCGEMLVARLRVARQAPEPNLADQVDGKVAEGRAAAFAPYRIRMPRPAQEHRPVVTHAIANFMTGGSSRLVIDLVEHMGGEYDQRILTSFVPTPAVYIGADVTLLGADAPPAAFVDALRSPKPDIVHVHYWGDSDEPWYRKIFSAAEALGLLVIENVNTPVLPHVSPSVWRYVYVSDYVKHAFASPDLEGEVIYPGSDLELFSGFGCAPDDGNTVGIVYRLERDKLDEASIDPLIKAVEKRAGTRALIVGGGSLLDVFRRKVSEAGLSDRFEFTGYVSYDRLPEFFARMTVFVAPVYKESFGQVSAFAMSMGKPVAGYGVGGILEMIDDPTLVAPTGDAEALADVIVGLLDAPALRDRIGGRNRDRARNVFAVQTMITRYADLYAALMRFRS